jgi:hypothetical protein
VQVMKARQMVLAGKNAYRASVVDWADLETGESVELFRHAQVIACGRVEEVSPSGSVLWLAGDGSAGKRHFVKSDGVLVRRALHVGS